MGELFFPPKKALFFTSHWPNNLNESQIDCPLPFTLRITGRQQCAKMNWVAFDALAENARMLRGCHIYLHLAWIYGFLCAVNLPWSIWDRMEWLEFSDLAQGMAGFFRSGGLQRAMWGTKDLKLQSRSPPWFLVSSVSNDVRPRKFII